MNHPDNIPLTTEPDGNKCCLQGLLPQLSSSPASRDSCETKDRGEKRKRETNEENSIPQAESNTSAPKVPEEIIMQGMVKAFENYSKDMLRRIADHDHALEKFLFNDPVAFDKTYRANAPDIILDDLPVFDEFDEKFAEDIKAERELWAENIEKSRLRQTILQESAVMPWGEDISYDDWIDWFDG
jgi:hypothetical protein